MYSHDGTWDFLKMLLIFGFIGVSVWWLDGAIGTDYTVLVIFALVGVIIFAGGAMYGHVNQKMTLDAITKFNANDARIDAARMQTFKSMAAGQSAMQKAAAQLTVLDAKRVDRLADQRAKVLLSDQQSAQPDETWTWDDESEYAAADNGASFQVWE